MTSRIFTTNAYTQIEQATLDLLNSQQDVLSISSLGSPRAAGDAIETILADNFEEILGKWCAEYSSDFARRAMADLAFHDTEQFYYIVDVKTHRTDTRFNMPNVTSVKRLARFYEDDRNYFVLMLVAYHIENDQLVFTSTKFVPIEFLEWSCLTMGALGWGQIQIANSNHITINTESGRRDWMLELCDVVNTFYDREIGKIGERKGFFERVKQFWLEKEVQ